MNNMNKLYFFYYCHIIFGGGELESIPQPSSLRMQCQGTVTHYEKFRDVYPSNHKPKKHGKNLHRVMGRFFKSTAPEL